MYKQLPNRQQNSLNGLSDKELVAEIISGKEHLLNELYRRYSIKVYYKCLSIVKDKSLAQDLAHYVFLKVFTNLHKYQGKSDLSFWIYAITYNHTVGFLRKKKQIRFDQLTESIDAIDDGEEALTTKLLQDLQLDELKRLLKKLKKEEEIILLMRYQDEMSIKQIAAILKLGESAVKMRLKRCRNHLAELFKIMDHE